MATFDEYGKYIKTDWKDGDKITAQKLNKIEAGVAAACNDSADREEVDARLDAIEAGRVSDKQEMNAIILSSPNGTLYKVTVADDGILQTSKV